MRVSRRRLKVDVEPLENRALMADLRGSLVGVSAGPAVRPGDTLRIDFTAMNDSPFGVGPSHEVGFYLSRDGVIDRSTDRLLKTGRFAPFMPPFYLSGIISEFVALPPSSDPIWNGDGDYTVGLYFDRLDEVFEENEFNNANDPFGGDLRAIRITGLTPPPDLVAESIVVAGSYTRGGTITVDFDVKDLRSVGTSGRPVTVAVRLAREGDSGREIGRTEVPPLAGGSAHGRATLALPAADDPIWADEVSRRTIELVVDPDGAIAEGDESNNAGRGLGVDRAAIDVVLTDFDPNALPESKHKPGTVLAQFLAAMNPWIGSTIKDHQGYAKNWRGVSVAPAIQTLQGVSTRVKTFANQLNPIVKSNGAPQPFTTTTTLDRTGLQWADRFILAFMTNRTGAGAVSATAARGVDVHAAADEPWWSAAGLKKLMGTWFQNTKQGALDAAVKYRKDLVWLTAIVGLLSKGAGLTLWPAGVLAVTAAGAWARTYYLQQTAKAADRGDKGTVEEFTRVEKKTTSSTYSITYDDDAPKFGKPLSSISKTTETVTKWTVDSRTKGIEGTDQILQMFDRLKVDPVRDAPFQGTFNGNYESETDLSSTGRQTGKMSIKFTSPPGSPNLSGSGYIDKVWYRNKTEVKRTKNTFTFTGKATGTVFSGSVTFADGGSYSIEGSVAGKNLKGYMGFSNMRYGAIRN